MFPGAGMIIASPPAFHNKDRVWVVKGQGHSVDHSKVIVSAKVGFDSDALKHLLTLSSSNIASECVKEDTFDGSSPCVTMETVLFPRDIMTSPSRFAELARWIFYGKRAPLSPRKDPTKRTPRLNI
jgi:hypothetical protein